MHFVGPVDQALRADARVPARQGRIEAVAQRAVELDGRVDHLVHHVRQKHLGDAVLLAQVHPLFGLVGDVHEHQAGDVELARAIRQHPLDALALRKRLAEGRAFDDVLGGHVECALGHCDVVHPVPEPAVGEPVLAHIEALALAAEQVFVGDDEVLDLDLRVAATEHMPERTLDRHRRDVPDDLVAGVRQLDDEGAELLVAGCIRVGLGHDYRDVGHAGGAAEPLFAVDAPVVAVADGAGLHAGASAPAARSVIE